MIRVCICGAFRMKSKPRGGQEIKTAILAEEFEKQYGKVYKIDTVGTINHVFLPLRLLFALLTCKNIIILPAQNGLIVESLLLRYCNTIFQKRLHYVVIGGWLQDYLPNHKYTANALKHFYGIYVETSTMKKALEKNGYNNIYLFHNFKSYNIVAPYTLNENDIHPPLRVCTFSRVSEMKGIGDAIRVIKEINKTKERPVILLDIYGPMEDCDKVWLENEKEHFTPEINYCGIVPFDKTTEVLSKYFALLFPTKYFTEGIPGTIMDAYAAGLPVISARWKSFEDVVEEGITGFGYDFDSIEALMDKLLMIIDNPSSILKLKNNCIRKAGEYLPQNVLPIIKLE